MKSLKWTKHDHYQTPKAAFNDIKTYIPIESVIWEPFYGNGQSGEFFKELGFNVIHEPNIDFFNVNRGDIVVTNPPYSLAKEIINRLMILDKPFMLLMPVFKLGSQYMNNAFFGKTLQLIIPKKRINYMKTDEHGKHLALKNSCTFVSIWYCYRMNLPKDIIWLD